MGQWACCAGDRRQWDEALRADRAQLDRPRRDPRQSLPSALAGRNVKRHDTPPCPSSSARPGGADGRARRQRQRAAAPGLEHLLAMDAALTAESGRTRVYDLGEVRGLLEYYTACTSRSTLAVTGAPPAPAAATTSWGGDDGAIGRPMPAVGVSLTSEHIAEGARDDPAPRGVALAKSGWTSRRFRALPHGRAAEPRPKRTPALLALEEPGIESSLVKRGDGPPSKSESGAATSASPHRSPPRDRRDVNRESSSGLRLLPTVVAGLRPTPPICLPEGSRQRGHKYPRLVRRTRQRVGR